MLEHVDAYSRSTKGAEPVACRDGAQRLDVRFLLELGPPRLPTDVEWERQEQVHEGVLQPPVLPLLPQVYDDVPPRMHAMALRSLKAHLFKLRDEARAAEQGGQWRLLREDQSAAKL